MPLKPFYSLLTSLTFSNTSFSLLLSKLFSKSLTPEMKSSKLEEIRRKHSSQCFRATGPHPRGMIMHTLLYIHMPPSLRRLHGPSCHLIHPITKADLQTPPGFQNSPQPSKMLSRLFQVLVLSPFFSSTLIICRTIFSYTFSIYCM